MKFLIRSEKMRRARFLSADQGNFSRNHGGVSCKKQNFFQIGVDKCVYLWYSIDNPAREIY